MIKLRIIPIIVILSITTLGQITQRNLFSSKYSAEFIKANLIKQSDWKPFPKTADEWQKSLPENIREIIIKKAEETSKKEIPQYAATLILEYVRNGNRSNYEAVSFARRKNLMNLVLAESIENKDRFTDVIANYVWTICEETYWGVPAHLAVQKARSGLPDAEDQTVDLFTAETAATLALADYFVGEKLDKVSPLLRKRIVVEANRKFFEPLKDSKRYNWLNPNRPVNNWNPWIVSNAMAANLLLEKDEAKRAENLTQYLKYLDIYLNGLGEDGGCDEGPSYWFAAGASVFDALEILDSVSNGKIKIYDEPLIGKMASYVYKVHIADNYFVNFADADPKFSVDGFVLYRFGKALNDKSLQHFGSYFVNRAKYQGETFHELGFFRTRHILDLLTIKEIADQKSDYTPVSDAWFNDIQVMTARSQSGLFLATHAGHNAESHNHNDVGDFIVYSNGEPIIIDSGRGNYTAKTFSSKRYELWFTQSEYHNLPIINGFGQKDGKDFRAEDVKYSANEKESSLKMNIAKSYPKDANINFWNRTVKLNRQTNNVEISDDYSLANNPTSLQQIFMTACDVDTSEVGKIKLKTPNNKVAILNYDAKLWKVAVELPSTEGAEYSSFVTKWDNRSIKRIVLTGENPKSINQLKYLITFQK
ncbi:MAG: heparinase II/III family protein [Acidobacteriota bacterium]